jgi:hypothetical protein
VKDLPLIQCGTCQWWGAESSRGDDLRFGHCMRHPPQLVPGIVQELMHEFLSQKGRAHEYGDTDRVIAPRCHRYPLTFGESYCGDWQENTPAMRKRLGPGVAEEPVAVTAPRKHEVEPKKKGAV